MNTPSHFLMTAGLDKAFRRVPIVKSAFLLGSVAPDIALWILSIGGIIYYHLILGWSMGETFRLMFDELYFHHPLWLGLCNLLHSPILLLSGLAIVFPRRNNIGSWERWFFWFLLACLFHTTVDIFTHADDGPLLFFPFEWSIRFNSPISYWDPRYYGREFALFELTLDLFLFIYLLSWRVRRFINNRKRGRNPRK